MNHLNHLAQIPEPGTHHLFFRGDTCTFTLFVPHDEKGSAWVRTNIGHAHITRQEIIREVLYDEAYLGLDWFDIPMTHKESKTEYQASRAFQLTLPLCEVGHFEAKCFFLKEGETNPIWPEGGNTIINVEPADMCCANIIYNAFVRQFGPNKSGTFFSDDPLKEGAISSLDQAGYAVIPPSGTFRDLIKELDFIISELGCRFIQLLPINPTPTIYGRMGRFGSPYAALNFRSVDPALAEFDPKATPLEQFIELADAIHERNAKLLLDIAINHTGWSARLHESHPEWLSRSADGNIEMPGAWGVVWEDLTKLDYKHRGLWDHIVKVFLTWCHRGVDGFRCDAGYMIPVPVWRYIIANVREQYPNTIFFLEGLGGKLSVTRDLLNRGNFDWAYSELFQNYDRSQIEHYLPSALEISGKEGIMIHFAETHDNNRLASRSKQYAKMRTALCALSSPMGGFAFANGVEWYATEKLDVHGAASLNWGSQENQVQHIRCLNMILKNHPAFHDKTDLKLIQKGGGNCIALLRHHIPSGKKLLIVANLDDERWTECEVGIQELGVRSQESGDQQTPNTKHQTPNTKKFFDLITEREITIPNSQFLIPNSQFRIPLEPGQVLCLSDDYDDIRLIQGVQGNLALPAERIRQQSFRAKALDVFRFYKGICDLGDFDPDQEAHKLAENPLEYCRSLNPFSEEPRVITWQWEQDTRREVMIPPDHFLLVRSPYPFHAQVITVFEYPVALAYEESLPCKDGSFFALFSPLPAPQTHHACTLKMSVFKETTKSGQNRAIHKNAPLLYLSHPGNAEIQPIFYRSELLHKPLLFLGTNGRGGMLRANLSWGKLNSKYDALLAANLNPDFPEDRRVMFTRCRAWVVFQGFSTEINDDAFYSFCMDEHSRGIWEYHLPTGQGEHISLIIQMEMIPGKNAIRMLFFRDVKQKTETWKLKTRDRFQRADSKFQVSSFKFSPQNSKLDDAKPVRLILRQDIEDRNFHETTKAYLGAEQNWKHAVKSYSNGFVFSPASNRHLNIRLSEGEFAWEPEWKYMVHHPLEAERGMDPDSDLFSPGYFSASLKGGESVELTAEVKTGDLKFEIGDLKLETGNQESEVKSQQPISNFKSPISNHQFQISTLDHFIVKREALNTVIAGYPWFLDWGRDTLIFVRGLIAVGRWEDSRAILKQFARFEQNGTLPNMIRGDDAGNRDTSDAPLWFFVACSDLIEAEGNEAFLDEICGERTIRQILISMAHSMINGTPNGIRMDPESGLIFSPSHYTWMDTNFPAGTPREGYPIEIQAMWHFALSFLARIEESGVRSYQTPNTKHQTLNTKHQTLNTKHQTLNTKHQFKQLASQVRSAILDLFFLEKEGFLSDCLHAHPRQSAYQAEPDNALRPNQLFAITLGAISDDSSSQISDNELQGTSRKAQVASRRILSACEELLVPGAIRSLADRPVSRTLEIFHNGNLLNNPHHPYRGKYIGDEDTSRKPAYHNGTAWSWVFPSFCEAWVMVYGESAKETALAWLASSTRIINEGCVGHVPEILDGDAPHTQRGCDAQAWGESELLRVWRKLRNERNEK